MAINRALADPSASQVVPQRVYNDTSGTVVTMAPSLTPQVLAAVRDFFYIYLFKNAS
jgi:hypothetical protein